MSKYNDNYIEELDSEGELDIITEYRESNKLASNWHEFRTFDMVQSGYPWPDHGAMIERFYGGTDGEGKLIPGNGMWVKLEDVLKYLNELKTK